MATGFIAAFLRSHCAVDLSTGLEMLVPDHLTDVVRTNEPLAPLVWLGIGGPAHYFAQPNQLNQVIELVQAAKTAGLVVRVLGSGSNVLVRESGVDGLVISLADAVDDGLVFNDSQLTVPAGTRLSHAVIEAVGQGLGGLEHLIGIPGTAGGAVVGNVSSGGRDIASLVSQVEVLEDDGTVRVIKQQEIEFSHRKSTLTGAVVLRVSFDLEPRDADELTKRMQRLWINRNAARPHEERRIATPFIDPDSMSAGDLIASVGLSGMREGDVSLDSQQPSYLVAHPGATSEQCLKLIDRVREQVLLQTGIDLQLNLQIW